MDLENLFHQTIYLRYFNGENAYGDRQYDVNEGNAHKFTCRVSGKEKEVRDDKGRELVSKLRVTILGDVKSPVITNGRVITPGLDSRSWVKLPDGCLPQHPPIVAVGRYPDESGAIHHTTIYF